MEQIAQAAVPILALLCGGVLHAADGPVAKQPTTATLTPAQAWKIGWPCLFGPNGNWSAKPSGQKLVDDISKVRHVWRSEQRIPTSKANNAGDPDWASQEPFSIGGGGASPILVDGRAYLVYFDPTGEAMDEIERYGGTRWNDGFRLRSYEYRERLERNGATRVGLIEADDVVLCVDARTGKTLWKRHLKGGANYQVRKNDAINSRTMCFDDGRVYALGSTCRLYCLDAVSGELIWESASMDHPEDRVDKLRALDLRRRAGSLLGGGGYQCLLAVEGKIIVPEDGGAALQAFDAATGRLLWTQPDAGYDRNQSAPAVWRHGGTTYLLGDGGGRRITCTDAATGKVVWRDEEAGVQQVVAIGDIVAGNVRIDRRDRKSPMVLAAFRLSPRGIEPLWQMDPAVGGYGYNGNDPSVDSGGNILAGRHTKARSDCLDAVLRVDPCTGKVLAVHEVSLKAHHLAVTSLDDGWIWGKSWYRGFVFLRADGKRRGPWGTYDTGHGLPQITDEGRMFVSPYHTPSACPYAAGRMVLRGEFHLHGLDFRADAKEEPAPDPLPAWAADLPEPVRSMTSRHQAERDRAVEKFSTVGKAERQRLVPPVLKLLAGSDGTSQLVAARALATPGPDAAAAIPAIRDALLQAVDAGRVGFAEALAVALRAQDAEAAGAAARTVAEKLGGRQSLRVQAACRALAAFGPLAAPVSQHVEALLDAPDSQVLRSALRTLGRIDAKGATAKRVAGLLAHESREVRVLAADALAGMGPAASAALPELEAALKAVGKHFQNPWDGRMHPGDIAYGRRLVATAGRLGRDALPLLRRLAEECEGPQRGVPYWRILGSLALLQSDAVPVALGWWRSDDEKRRAMAVNLVEVMVRQGTPAKVLEPFWKPLLDGKSTAAKVRAAEWLLRIDASDARGFEALVDLCERDQAPAGPGGSDPSPTDVRRAAADALSRQIIRPHNKMSGDARRRGVKAIVSVIRRGLASPVAIVQCSGMAPFIDKDDLELVERAKKEFPMSGEPDKVAPIPYR